MPNRLILFLVRRKLGVRDYEEFRFKNQKSNAIYWIAKDGVWKLWSGGLTKSHVSLNWLLADECEITKLEIK